MKKKGFTLVELLAVIVILAVIALIATPTILGVIEKAKKEAAEQSAYGYIDAIEKQILINETSNSKEQIKDGIYNVSDLEVSYKGEKIKYGQVTIEKGKATKTKLCINKYSIDYEESKIKISSNNYCSNEYKIELIIEENKQSKNIGKENSTIFELTDISSMTNVSCNNGAIPTIENNTLIINNIYGDTTCKINDNLEETINQLDNTETNIIMLNDEEVSDTLTIKEKQNVILELNGKLIEYIAVENIPLIHNNGNLIINDQIGMGTIKSNYTIIKNCGNIDIYNGYFSSIFNAVLDNFRNGIININGGIYISEVNAGTIINNSTGPINITDQINKVYIANLKEDSTNIYEPKAIINRSSGNVNINGLSADRCDNTIGVNTKGICIYSNYRTVLNESMATGTINILNSNIYSDGDSAIKNSSIGIINLCNSYISGNSTYDLYNLKEGYIYYNNKVILDNNYDTNNPSHIILNNTITCK